MVEVITTKLREFKAITRWVTDAERAWRRAVDLLRQTQRTRQRETAAAAKASSQPKQPVSPPRPAVQPDAPKPGAPVTAIAAAARRE